MAFDFQEDLTVYLPQLGDQVKDMREAVASDQKKLVIELAAIHEGLTSNYNNYSADELNASLSTWVMPYPKPIITNHNPESDSVGRVMAARMEKEADGSQYIRLQVAVTSPDAIEKCLDERFLTGSVGGRAKSATCSVCNAEWANASMYSPACKHQRGKVYNGKLASMNLTGIEWKEYSFVNMPADSKSTLRAINPQSPASMSNGENDGWIKAVSVFTLDMNKESIAELTESEMPREILQEMSKKNAHATYLNVKGTFLSVNAYDYKESHEKSLFDETHTTISNEPDLDKTAAHNHSEENKNMSKVTEEVNTEEEEDILAVADQLSADLASKEEISADVETVEETATEETDKSSEVTEEVTAPEETVAESQEDEKLAEQEEESTPAEPTEASDTQVEVEVKESDTIKNLEESLGVAEASNTKLAEENKKLKKALHNMLAERVVDAKIAVGLLEHDVRATALAEHVARTASSLADALRDTEVYALSTKPVTHQAPKMASQVASTEHDKQFSVVVEEKVETAEISPALALENILVDVLGKKKKF